MLFSEKGLSTSQNIRIIHSFSILSPFLFGELFSEFIHLENTSIFNFRHIFLSYKHISLFQLFKVLLFYRISTIHFYVFHYIFDNPQNIRIVLFFILHS